MTQSQHEASFDKIHTLSTEIMSRLQDETIGDVAFALALALAWSIDDLKPEGRSIDKDVKFVQDAVEWATAYWSTDMDLSKAN